MNACPKEAISISYDINGLMLPKIDQEKCVNCGLCTRTCPVNITVEKKAPLKAYAAWNLDDKKHALSSSGGLARAMYDYAIDNGGVCYGTRFDENLDLRIVRADKREEIEEFQSSKYVQAIVGDSFKQAEDDLKMGLLVVYVGTPCQIAGLKNYLKKDYDNLITADLICHGVPSIKYLHEHVEHLEKKIGKKADNVKFRGVYNFKMSLFNKGELIYCKDRWQDTYFTGFLESLFYRPNCYECSYACPERVSDITLGDFWGIGKEKTFNSPKVNGVSVVLPLTEKGLDFIEKMKDKLYLEERSVSEAVNGNDQLNRPSRLHANTSRFIEMYHENGFEKAAFESIKEDMKKNQAKKRKSDRLHLQAKVKWKIVNTFRKITGRGVK